MHANVMWGSEVVYQCRPKHLSNTLGLLGSTQPFCRLSASYRLSIVMPDSLGMPWYHVLCRQVLVLVHSVRGRPGATSYAGLLLERGCCRAKSQKFNPKTNPLAAVLTGAGAGAQHTGAPGGNLVCGPAAGAGAPGGARGDQALGGRAAGPAAAGAAVRVCGLCAAAAYRAARLGAHLGAQVGLQLRACFPPLRKHPLPRTVAQGVQVRVNTLNLH